MSTTAEAKIVSIVKDTRKLRQTTRGHPDVVILTPESVKTWKSPPFQREKRITKRVQEYAEAVKDNDGVMPGTPLQVGIWQGERYIVDGQHRLAAFEISGLPEAIANVVYTTYPDGPDGWAEMAEDYRAYNSKLVTQRPDDLLKAAEYFCPAIKLVRKEAPFVGYDMIRRNQHSPVVSMSAVLRNWAGSEPVVPTSGGSVHEYVRIFTVDDARTLLDFLGCALKAWGRDQEYWRLWSALNLTLCAWLYRRLVITPYSPRTPRLTRDQFTLCLMSVSATTSYVDWLLGRHLNDRDRSPCYQRLKAIFAARLQQELGKKVALPDPPWSSHLSGL